MDDDNKFEQIINLYNKTKEKFQISNQKAVGEEIAEQIKEYISIFRDVFNFLIVSFNSKLRKDEKTPLVFHSICLTYLIYKLGERDLDTLLTASLHDVLEDTKVTEDILEKQSFLKNKPHITSYLTLLKEDPALSREPDGKNLPPRHKEHIKRLIGTPKEVINVEIMDRFSDLMDLDYILKLPDEQKMLRLKSKLIKVRSFIDNIIRNRQDFNRKCLSLFLYKLKKVETDFNVIGHAELVFP